ncbi:Glycoside hydrolase OS=Streptomyces violarus OX=67380 GN=FHS41_005087 PE=4 SV=1 [Streptomyces violarus]
MFFRALPGGAAAVFSSVSCSSESFRRERRAQVTSAATASCPVIYTSSGGTLEDTSPWLLPFLRSGANLYNPHASYFGTAGGWFERAPPSTDWRQPYWKQYPAFSRAVARICSIMSRLRRLCGGPAPDRHDAGPRPAGRARPALRRRPAGRRPRRRRREQRHYLDLCGTNNWLAPQPGALDRRGISFDVVDDYLVQRAKAADGALRIRDLAYRAVLLPSVSVLEEETARRLTELLDAGGRVVVVGRPPATAAGRSGDDSVVAALLAHPRLERVRDPESGAAAVADAAGHATGEVPLLVRRTGNEAVALVTAAFPEIGAHPLRAGPPPRVMPSAPRPLCAGLGRRGRGPDPATGARAPAHVTVSADGAVSTIDVPLDGAPAALVVWREGRPAPRRPQQEAPPARVIDVSTGWHGRLVPTMDNTWGDLALPPGSSVDEPQIWAMEWTEGGTWERTRVTYGNRVRVLPPVPFDQVPEPLDATAVERILAGELPLVPPDTGWDVAVYSSSRASLTRAGCWASRGW